MQPLVFLGTQGGCIVGSSDFQCPAGFGLDEFAEWSGGVSERKGFYYVERRQNRAPRSFQTLKAFSENG